MEVVATMRAFGAGLRLWARVVRTEPALAVAIVAATLVGVILVATGSRLLFDVSEDDLRQAAELGHPDRRSVRFETGTRIGAAPKPRETFEFVSEARQRFFEEEMPEEVRAVVMTQHFVIETPSFVVSSFPDEVDGPFPTTFRFRYQDGIDEQMTVVAGRMPAERDPVPMLRGDDCPDDQLATADFERDDELDCRVVLVPVHEVAMTAATAADMMLELGDLALLRPEPLDPAWTFARRGAFERRIILSVSAIVELSDLSSEYWYGDGSLHRPSVTENPDFRFVFASGVFAPDRYGRLVRDIPDVPFDYTWRYLVDTDLLRPDEARDLGVELEKPLSSRGRVVTRLPVVIDEYFAQRVVTVALMSTAFTGVLVVSGAAIFILASLAGHRQEPTMRQLLERGVARRGLVAVGLFHGLVVAVPSAALALTIAGLAVPEGPWTQPVVATVAVAGSTVLALVAAVAIVSSSAARARSGGPAGADRNLPNVRRAVRDGLVVVVGVAAVLLVRRRAAAVEPVDAATDFDALLAATPVLVGLAVGVVLLWVIGPLNRLLAVLGRHGRGLTPFLGFRRLSVQQRSARSAMLVVLLATAIAGFSTAVRTSIADAQQSGAQQIVGADAAIRGQGDGVPVPPSVVAAGRGLAAVDAVAVEVPRASVLNPPDSAPVNVLAVELDAYRRVLGESLSDATVLEALDRATARGGAVPAIVSSHWPGANRPGVGDTLEIIVGDPKALEVTAVADRFPSLPVDEPFVVVDLDRLQQLDPSRPLAATALYLGDLTASPEAIVAAVSEAGSTSRVLVREELLADLASDPFVSWVGRGLGALAVVAVVAAVIAATAGLAHTAPTRRRDLTLLAAMGLRSRQATALTALEHFLPAVLAVVAGTALALGLIELMAPALELDAFAGGPEPVILAADPWYLVAAGAAVVVAVATSTVGAVRFEASEGAGSILSAGEE